MFLCDKSLLDLIRWKIAMQIGAAAVYLFFWDYILMNKCQHNVLCSLVLLLGCFVTRVVFELKDCDPWGHFHQSLFKFMHVSNAMVIYTVLFHTNWHACVLHVFMKSTLYHNTTTISYSYINRSDVSKQGNDNNA